MKKILTISIFILLVACSVNNDKLIAAKMIRMENEIDSLDSAVRSAEIKLETTINTKTIDARLKTEERLTALKNEYQTLLKTTIWYKGRELPFEPMLVGLDTDYDLNDFNNWSPKSSDYKRTYQILLPTQWNMEDVTKIKTVIMKTFKFAPKTDTDRQGNIDQLTWTGSAFDVEVYKSGSHNIGLYFFIK